MKDNAKKKKNKCENIYFMTHYKVFVSNFPLEMCSWNMYLVLCRVSRGNEPDTMLDTFHRILTSELYTLHLFFIYNNYLMKT